MCLSVGKGKMEDKQAETAEAFEQLISLLDYPMFVVTTHAGDENAGCLVGFATQVSIRPPRFLVGLSKRNRTYRVATQSEHLAVHLVPRNQTDLARLFGAETGDEINKFERCQWQAGPEGMPVLTEAVAWFTGKILNRIDVGDHVAHLLEPTAAQAPDQFDGLVTFADVKDIDPGHDA
jgi:flavin reductase (DIM6/NTAB) family NADH-FMN oxidoreductase RutF